MSGQRNPHRRRLTQHSGVSVGASVGGGSNEVSDRPEIEIQRQTAFGDDGLEVTKTSVETSLEDFGADVDHRDRDSRLDRPEASKFGVDDRPEVEQTSEEISRPSLLIRTRISRPSMERMRPLSASTNDYVQRSAASDPVRSTVTAMFVTERWTETAYECGSCEALFDTTQEHALHCWDAHPWVPNPEQVRCRRKADE